MIHSNTLEITPYLKGDNLETPSHRKHFSLDIECENNHGDFIVTSNTGRNNFLLLQQNFR